MKYIKAFEFVKVVWQSDERPEEKNYIIARAPDVSQSSIDHYLRTTIGQIIEIHPDSGPREFDYKVRYDDPPYNNVRWVSYPEILFWSSNKKELKSYLKGRQFDL